MKMTYTEFLALVNRADKIQEKLYTLKEEQIKEYSSEKMRHINFLENKWNGLFNKIVTSELIA
jgi:hypothetical protein|tara:strand:+ start:2398 stop:2586 length:189 start_codon:yes stop_codon:yes gene_type:complete